MRWQDGIRRASVAAAASLSAVLPRSLDLLGGYALSRTRTTKRWIVMLVDAGLCATTCYLAIFLRLGFLPQRDTPYGLMVAVSVVLALPVFSAMGMYREIFSQTGVRAIVAAGRACLVYALPFATIFTYIGVWGIPRTISVIQPILLFVSIAGSRIFARYWLFGTNSLRRVPRRRVLIYGAGSAGRQLAGAIAQSSDMAVVGYFDDNPALFGSVLDGCRIYSPVDMAMAVERLTADEILIALPSAPRARRKAIIAEARRVHARVRTLPGLMDIAHGRVEMTHLRDVDIEDLLGRELVEPDRDLMQRSIAGKVVMVTGAGGSIGGEICRQLLALEPAVLLLFEISEFGLYEIHRELTATAPDASVPARIIPLLGSVNDEARVEEVVATWRPDIIYHAAAYKHVPIVERNPAVGVRTNVLGTLTMAKVAASLSVANFTLISTDKAVRPTNVMGVTKRIAELVLQALDQSSPATRYSIVRFGNVLDTSGSVVPLFRHQIRNGGPVTLTDRRITRYFMTAPEAAELVLQASAMACGGDVFVLDMGEPVRIRDLATNMVELAGLTVRSDQNPSGDIEIVEIGLRPGEKLYEELLIGNNPSPTGHPRILKAHEAYLPFARLRGKLARLETLLDAERRPDLLAALKELVPEFEMHDELVDWVCVESERMLAQAPIAKTA
ncbi:MAG TPA: nucleoside-diphosphate sugar epimerase/dehydratase [Sphingomicrobium sp.]|nr:nucleoside-diphosphate sugar epimerase/dehydratase [Sphingomicrobium sp.]